MNRTVTITLTVNNDNSPEAADVNMYVNAEPAFDVSEESVLASIVVQIIGLLSRQSENTEIHTSEAVN